MMFSKRHYDAVAKTLLSVKPSDNTKPEYKFWRETVEAFVLTFSVDSDKFKRSVFERAAGAPLRFR